MNVNLSILAKSMPKYSMNAYALGMRNFNKEN